MSVILAGALFAAAVVAGAGTLLLRRRSAPEPEGGRAGAGPRLGSRFPLEAGEVVDLAGEEVWLSEAWLLEEGAEPIAALLFAEPTVVLVLPEPDPLVYRLGAVQTEFVGEPPPVLELDRSSFERVRRLPVRLRTLTPSRPVPFIEGLLFEYRGLDERLWVLSGATASFAWRGRALVRGTMERWGVADGG